MKTIKAIAKQYSVSEDTVRILLEGLKQSGGSQVQFNIPELGGMGQWQGGMVMIGDMFNNSLKAKVSELCAELAPLAQELIQEEQIKRSAPPKTTPSKKGASNTRSSPSFSGSQNGVKYRYFSAEDLLEIEENGKVKSYNTKGYALSGVQQAQDNNSQTLSFSYPGGTVKVKDLKKA